MLLRSPLNFTNRHVVSFSQKSVHPRTLPSFGSKLNSPKAPSVHDTPLKKGHERIIIINPPIKGKAYCQFWQDLEGIYTALPSYKKTPRISRSQKAFLKSHLTFDPYYLDQHDAYFFDHPTPEAYRITKGLIDKGYHIDLYTPFSHGIKLAFSSFIHSFEIPLRKGHSLITLSYQRLKLFSKSIPQSQKTTKK